MGSPVSGIVCDLYMEEYEEKALSAAKHPPRWWKRYVDDTHTVLKKGYSQEFTDHLNSIDEDIKWTTEGETLHGEERTLAFLDTMSVVHDDGHISTRVYRKDTHTDQYLNFESNHPLEHKRGVVNTLMYRADMVVSEPAEREKEKGHIKDALSVNGYPKWMFKTRTTNKPTTRTNHQTVEAPRSHTSSYHTSGEFQKNSDMCISSLEYQHTSNRITPSDRF